MTRLQDDFYEYVNGEWAKAAVIPDDKPRTGGFTDLADDIEKLMIDTTNAWLAGENVPEDSVLQNFVAFHKQVADYETRDRLGAEPAQALIAEYKSLNSFEEFTSKLAEYELAGKPNLMPFGVAPDFMDATTNVLWADSLGIILPDTTYYEEGHEKGAELLKTWRESQEALLPKFGFSDEEIKDLLDKRLELDAMIAKYVLSNEEGSEYAKLYHPYEWADFTALIPELPLDDFFTAILGQTPDNIIVPEERFWQAAKDIYSADNWELLKATLILKAAGAYTAFLSDEIRILAGAYSRALSGTPQAQNQEKAAYNLAQGYFNQALGLWYAGEKFSPEAKADVEAKVAKMIEVYKSRLETADWLAQETRDKAIVKLNVIKPYIGYPETLPERYYKKIVDPGKSLVENAIELNKIDIAHGWSKWNKPVDIKEWGMPAHMVNAYYNPQKNLIVFPAAILQAPFYSLEQSSSANYGGIGAVIAHEISHAFDSNGASFDEHGSLNNWWTEEDYAAFEARTQQVIDQFEGQDSYGAKINGKLTVSENIADLGGIAAALEAAKSEDDFSAEEFFTNFARIWRMKARPEFMQMLASVDVHAPGHLRTNIQLPNFDEFHETFGVQEGDGMWRAKEDRVIIW
ncbi:TPA: endopeptidase [Streptococcus suis]|nr:endopeptidase [Streptococcus suis]NQO40687.1 endopeptidase [Streptococcus suis]NQP23949.1 endopeptidase [Streptococcus suis]NQP25916.1 endopeptidase [Streptococcus suis]HEL1738993.1 endopeptidase [Streptococcus suis]